jgi:hypothetical protein
VAFSTGSMQPHEHARLAALINGRMVRKTSHNPSVRLEQPPLMADLGALK